MQILRIAMIRNTYIYIYMHTLSVTDERIAKNYK